jgi:hypothetical protein
MSLFSEIIKTRSIHFRNVQPGDTSARVKEVEGNECEEKLNSNPCYRYFFEVGEMEEVVVYYNFDTAVQFVTEITVFFIHYPDHYWRKAGNTDLGEFENAVNKGSLPGYCNEVFEQTYNEVMQFFRELISSAPSVSLKDGAFNKPHQQFNSNLWELENDRWLSVMRYVDDTDFQNVRNTMKIYFR